MCLAVFAYRMHPEFDLIFAANRDEFYERPSRPAQYWDSFPQILGGQDERSGGTWLGVTTGGRFSALTNYRDLRNIKEDAPSRGHLVLNFLKGDMTPEQYMKKVESTGEMYNGFNLLAGYPNHLYYISNEAEGFEEVKPGIHGLSNHLLDTPWPKVERAKRGLRKLIEHDHLASADVFELLQNSTEAEDDQLPDTGLSKEREKQVSPIFITTPDYGTRNSTIVTVDKKGEVWFHERVYKDGSTKIEEEHRYTFYIKGYGDS